VNQSFETLQPHIFTEANPPIRGALAHARVGDSTSLVAMNSGADGPENEADDTDDEERDSRRKQRHVPTGDRDGPRYRAPGSAPVAQWIEQRVPIPPDMQKTGSEAGNGFSGFPLLIAAQGRRWIRNVTR
jgi:hypothetical protein